MDKTIAVFGRANADLTVRVPHRASEGRAAFGSPLAVTPGGKAFNQACAVARLGGRAALIANAGDDEWGRMLARTLAECGVDGAGFRLLPGVPTGAAVIEVTPDGESYVTFARSPGTDPRPADAARVVADVVVAQLDVPPEAVRALPRPPLLIGNLVPDPGLDTAFLSGLDLYAVNEHEAAAVLGTSRASAAEAVDGLLALGVPAAVVTAGRRGAAYGHLGGTGTVSAPRVDAVDSSGAGDAFLAALALELSRDRPLPDAVAVAVRVGSRAVRQRGSLLR
ncbi:ribokinase [Paractinoplanes deccanensis]|uniref:Ribokinase n=1 Tax=Paractinoplanes deccanensis TaxID=113561 RepID=A0ABQ3YAP1_9ACTN|nr:PfkB family carbohydrate kinase [Actinoplanes deccanensis]GID77037.1 ribokinase [Actinoplanes deccanensis]